MDEQHSAGTVAGVNLLRRALAGNLRAGGLAIFARCLTLCAALVAAPAFAGDLQSDIFDPHFKRAAARWLPEYDWRWLRAQCFQESRFDPRAVSPAGARGLCQFMPGTWREAQRALKVRNVFDPTANSWAAAWYMRRMLRIWTADRTRFERLQLAQASYNAGAGHIIAAQKRCGGPPAWREIQRCLPAVTGRHSAETITYVARIARWFEEYRCLPN